MISEKLKELEQGYTEQEGIKEDKTKQKEAEEDQTDEDKAKYLKNHFSASRGKRYGGWGNGAEASTDFDFWTPR